MANLTLKDITRVSILILLDILLLQEGAIIMNPRNSWVSFNPYFTGYTTFTYGTDFILTSNCHCFNPYFTGYTTFTLSPSILDVSPSVSILILLDILLLP